MFNHFDNARQKAVLLLSVTATMVLIAVAVTSVVQQHGSLSPGFVVWRNLVVPAVSSTNFPDPGVLLPYRSVLTHVEGKPVRDVADLYSIIEQAPVGTFFRYTFVHDGQDEERSIRSRRLGWSTLIELVGPYLLNGIVLLITALVVYYFKPDLPAARAFLALALTFGGMMLLAIDAFWTFRADRLCFVLDSLVPAALVHFALCFPEPKQFVRRHPWVEAMPYLLCLPLAVLQNLFLASAPASHLRTSDWVYTADAAAALVAVLALVHAFTRSRSPVARQQARAVAAGFALASFVPALVILAVVVLRADLAFNPLAVILVVCPLSIGYAIARHNLFEVDRFLRTGVVYGALTLMVFLAYAAIVLSGEYLLAGRQPLAGALIPIYLVVVLLVAEPLRRRIQNLVDRLLYRQSYSFRATVEASSAALASMLSTDGIAANVLGALTGALAVDWAALVVRQSDDRLQTFVQPQQRRTELQQLVEERAEEVTQSMSSASIATLRWQRRSLAGEGGRSQGDADQTRREAVLAVPVRTTNAALGVLLLSEKKSGAFYSDEDLDLLQTLANQAALALTNAEAFEALQRAQGELVQSERLAAVGELSATVAHGIRNPLAGIRVAAQVARESHDDPAAIAESLDDIIAESDRLEQRVRAILDLARPANPTLVKTEAGALFVRFAEMINRRLPPTARLTVHCMPDLPPVCFDANQLIEVLEILVNNAVEATKGVGNIELSADVVSAGGEARAVLIEVRDHGPGIDAARLNRVFELFYTTKGTGTGVGLAMAKRLVERQHGTLTATSTAGHGAVFLIQLPLWNGTGAVRQ